MLLVFCIVLNFGHYTYAQDVSSPVCKWNSAKSTCEKDPSKMIELLTSTNETFGLLMRCQYATSKSLCNNMSQKTCTWKNNACQISSKKLINQINECFSSTFCSSDYTSCKNELQNISKNSTWIDRNSFPPAPSCNETIGCFSFTKDTCMIMRFALQGTNYDAHAYQLVSDLRYIMGISQRNLSSSLQDLENYLDIKSGNLQLYDSCRNIYSRYQCERYIMGISQRNLSSSLQDLENYLDIKSGNLQLYDSCSNIYSRYQCEHLTSPYSPSPRQYYSPSPRQYQSPSPRQYYSPSPRQYYSPSPRYYYSPSLRYTYSPRYYYSPYYYSSRHQDQKSNTNILPIVLSIFFGVLFISMVYCMIRFQKVQSTTQSVDTTPQNVAMTVVNNNEEPLGNLQSEATVEIIGRLPNLEFKVQEGHEHSEAICCICLESLKEGDSSTVLPCTHWFHKECSDKWIQTKGRNVSCPLCNNTLYNTQQPQQ